MINNELEHLKKEFSVGSSLKVTPKTLHLYNTE